MKFPIAWHENNLVNFKKSLESKKRELERVTQDVVRMEREITFKQVQIEEAKTQKKDGFDEEKFMLKYKPNP